MKRPDCMGDSNYYGLTEAEQSEQPAELTAQQVRINAKTGESYCLEAILSALHNPDYYIRTQAAWELGATGDVECVPALIEAMSDAVREVREAAHHALCTLDTAEEPLYCRVLLCDTLDAQRRTDILKLLVSKRYPAGSPLGFPNVAAYCREVLEQTEWEMEGEEKVVLERLKRGAKEVLAELQRRKDDAVLLRPSSSHNSPHQKQLLRSAPNAHDTRQTEHLLTPAEGPEE